MGRLSEIARDPGRRPGMIAACVQVLDDEVRAKRGVVGLAVRTAYGAVGRLDDGRIIRGVIDMLLDQFAAAVDPFVEAHEELPAGSGGGFSAYLGERADSVADALLGVTDRQRDVATNPVLIRAYNGLRGPAQRLVAASVPALAAMLEAQLEATV